MGWFGYGIYSGDNTQTCHYDFLEWLGFKEKEIESWLGNKTKIPKKHIETLKNGLAKIIKKMPKRKYFTEDSDAIEWQMLLALLLDNKIKPNKIIYEKGISATNYLMGKHADDFDAPPIRRAALRRFIKRAEKLGCAV